MSVRTRGRPWLRAAGAAAATVTGAALLQIGPGATWLPPVRRAFFPALAGTGRSGHLALTFDDGPDAEGTPAVLAALDGLGWRATFFMLGSQVRARPGLAREVAQAGHEIALHGDTHEYLFTRSHRAVGEDLERGLDSIGAATEERPRWFRPPYGVLTTSGVLTARRLLLQPVLWSAWGRDWRAEATAASVTGDLRRGMLDGGTVLLHDSDVSSAPGSWRTTVAALPMLAEEVARTGLTVGPLAAHAVAGRQRGVAGGRGAHVDSPQRGEWPP